MPIIIFVNHTQIISACQVFQAEIKQYDGCGPK